MPLVSIFTSKMISFHPKSLFRGGKLEMWNIMAKRYFDLGMNYNFDVSLSAADIHAYFIIIVVLYHAYGQAIT